MEKELLEHGLNANRRKFISRMSLGLGSAALGSLLIPDLFGGKESAEDAIMKAVPHIAPKAKRVIYLFQNGAPSQLETFDYKPMLRERMGEDLPESIRNGQRLTGMTAGQSKFPLIGSYYDFKQYGKSGAYVSDLFPHMASVVMICVSLNRCTQKLLTTTLR